MPPPREIELKLDVQVHNLPRLTDSSVLKGASKSAAKPINLVSVYFDTNKQQLHQKGLSLRVRRIGRRHVQTIKQENKRKRGSVCSRRMGTRRPRKTTRSQRSA